MKRDSASDSQQHGEAGMVPGLDVSQLPEVPPDAEAVRREADTTTRRIPEASRGDAIEGLTEIGERGRAHAGELGDLAPDTRTAATLAVEIKQNDAVIARLRGLLGHAEARALVLDDAACRLLDDVHELVDLRTQRGRLQVDTYPHVRRFVGQRGVIIAQGIARAQRAKAAVRAAAPANESADAKKTG